MNFRLSEELYERAQDRAAADRRTLSNWLALIVERALDDGPPSAVLASDAAMQATIGRIVSRLTNCDCEPDVVRVSYETVGGEPERFQGGEPR